MELNNFRVSSSDPFLNATKWNGSLEFSRNFENMITSMLGSKFKGIYKPEKEYQIGEYVWFEDACYIISSKQKLAVKSKGVENPIVAFKSKNGFYAIKSNKITNFTESGEEIKSIKKVDNFFYQDSKDCFYAFNKGAAETRVYKIDSKGKSEAVNSNIFTELKSFNTDDFKGYGINTADKLKCFSLGDVSKNTIYEDIQFSTNYPIVHFDVDANYIYALNSNGDFMVIAKSGGVINSTNIKSNFYNINLVKFAVSDSKLVGFSDKSEIKVFLLEKNALIYCYKMDSGIGNVDNITFSNKHFTFNNSSYVGYVLASKYELSPANIRNLISSSSTIEVRGAILALDFGKGQLNSSDLTITSPSGFIFKPENTNNFRYSDSINNVQFVANRGVQLHGSKLVYGYSDLNNKTIICEFDSATPNVEFVSVPVGESSFKLKPSLKQITGMFKTAYEIESGSIKATVSSGDKVIETFVINNKYPKKPSLEFASNNSVVLSKVIVSDKIEKPTIDFLLNCSYIINDCYLNAYLPTHHSNKNGFRFIKNSNKSIVNEETGIRVNLSSNSELNDSEIALSTAGGKQMLDLIKAVKDEVDKNLSQKDHKHKFSELQETPIASVNGTKGIVSLNNSNTDSNQATAATSYAVKKVNDAVTEATRVANTKLDKTPGVTSGFYLKHSAGISGNLAQVLKDGKTGMFNGTGLTNELPWGTHSWKYYFANSHANSAGYTGIIGLDFDGSEMGYSSVCNGVFKPWRRLWSSANFDPNTKSNNHDHPYLHSNGGTLNGNLKINGGTLTLAKNDGHSFIKFDAQTNDAGYIMHYENNNISNMRFVVSDDKSKQDYFSWGSNPGGNYSQCAYLYTDGYFHTEGDIHSSGDITAFSDARLKENIIPIPTPLELTNQLNGVIFDRIDNGLRQTGLIAQDVLKVLPEAVSVDDKGYYSVNYGSLVGLLVESIKELQERVKILENKK